MKTILKIRLPPTWRLGFCVCVILMTKRRHVMAILVKIFLRKVLRLCINPCKKDFNLNAGYLVLPVGRFKREEGL